MADAVAIRAAPGLVACQLAIPAGWLGRDNSLVPAFYTAAFDLGIDALKQVLGINEAYRREQHRSTVALEAHVRILLPVPGGSTVTLSARIVDCDAKRLHVAQEMTLNGPIAALRESMTISFDLAARRSCAFGVEVAARIKALHDAQQCLPRWSGEAHLLGVDRAGA
jgi:acyl-CoA thioester hydrolase